MTIGGNKGESPNDHWSCDGYLTPADAPKRHGVPGGPHGTS